VETWKLSDRHTGGSRRPTFVGGQPVDLVMLEDGDEFTVGPHKFRAEVRTLEGDGHP
jgi:hypothetical protein